MFKYRFGGPALPDYEFTTQAATYFVTVNLSTGHELCDSQDLMKVVVEEIGEGMACVTQKPLHYTYPMCISLPVHGFRGAVSPLIIASALPVAELRLSEIEMGFVEINTEFLFREA